MKTTRFQHTSLAVVMLLVFGILLSPAGTANSQSGSPKPLLGFRVWMKVEPCAVTRQDWITVARENPTQIPNVFMPSPLSSGRSFATLAAAFAQADIDRIFFTSGESTGMPKFENYCCDDYSVWRDVRTGAFTVLTGKLDQPGVGNFDLVKSGLCCEQAFALAGLFGGCTDTTLANGTVVRYTGNPRQPLAGLKGPVTVCFEIPAIAEGTGGVIAGPGGTTGLINQPAKTPARTRKPKVEELPEDADQPSSVGTKPPADSPSTSTQPPAGSLPLVDKWVRPYRGREACCGGYSESVYGETTAARNDVYGRGDGGKQTIKWTFSGSFLRGSLTPGEVIVIDIQGTIDQEIPRALPISPMAGVTADGLEVIERQDAVVNTMQYKDKTRAGKYTLKVPANATSVTIELWADHNIGTFARYCYGKCTKK
jgi:hypothetical protein